jgi:hypothetical protein
MQGKNIYLYMGIYLYCIFTCVLTSMYFSLTMADLWAETCKVLIKNVVVLDWPVNLSFERVKFYIHMSVHRNIITNYNQQDATFLQFISTDALNVSDGSSTHPQEHITVHIASGIVKQYCCYLLSWRWNWSISILFTVAAISSIGWQYLKL